MSLNLDKIAEQIVTLNHAEQEALFEKVVELSFQRDLATLVRQYRERLAGESKLPQEAEEVIAELERIREEVAARDYRA